jgi:hypothetical protein
LRIQEEKIMHLTKSWFRVALPAIILSTAFAGPTRAELISNWNVAAEAIAIEKRLLPPPNARGMALLHVAMFEAVNVVDRKYAPYKLKLAAEPNTSKEAAAAAAAHAVLGSLHPDQRARLDGALADSLGPIAEGEPKSKGISLGRKVAEEILALRADDDANAPESYRPYTIAGAYVPTIVPVSSTYGAVRPWVMEKGSQFRPAPPPPLDSATWTNDLNEIRELAGRASSKRTAEQTAIARFWFMTGPQAWNPIVRQLATAKKLDLVDSARLFALVAIASDDAFIAVFDAKYHYNFWRPVTAIRNADLTGNKATPRDPAWLPFGQSSLPSGDTPMHPEYPCAHCAQERFRQRNSGSLDDQHCATGDHAQMDAHPGLHRRSVGCPNLRGLPLPLLRHSRRGDGPQDRRTRGRDPIAQDASGERAAPLRSI